ncbi:MAG TPA: ribosome small subunit-dependent GTPase A [Gaiellaceae bacterium]
MHLESLGWDASFADEFRPFEHDGLAPARVAVEHRSEYVVYSQHGELRAELTGRLRHGDEHPAVGDWVAVAPRPDEGRATIHAVLPRRSAFVRKVAWAETKPQVVAANVDVAFVVAGLDLNYNVRRIERYLTLAWESGAQPVVLLTKADLCEDVESRVYEVESVAFGVPVHPVSAPHGDGVDTVRSYVPPGRTAALLGSSGVGKSTLVNALVGTELLAVREIREDGRGRHTTSHRQLVPLPEGGLVLDTPGMRELQLWDADSGIEAAFQDLESLAAECRFADCAHRREPGCAVRAALANGTLEMERFESWRKLQRELERLAMKQDARARSESRKERARFARSMRKTSY